MRTIIDLTAQQLEALDRWRRREGLSRAEAVRRAIDAHVKQVESVDARQAFGLWRRDAVDALAFQRKLRAEWGTGAPARRRR